MLDPFSRRADAWKSDPTGDHGPGKKFFRVIEKEHQYGFNAKFNWILEATGTGRGGGYHNAHVDVACDNLTAIGSTAVSDYANDWTRHTTIHGTFRVSKLPDGTVKRGAIVLCELATVRDAVVPDIRIIAPTVKPAKDGDAPQGKPRKRYPRDITIRDTKIIENGDIEIREGATGIRLNNVTFTGQPRRIIHIRNESEPDRPVTLHLEKISAPAGSTIEADDAGRVSVTLDGRKITLPHRF